MLQEEEEVISAHRKEVEDTMEIVREVRVDINRVASGVLNNLFV